MTIHDSRERAILNYPYFSYDKLDRVYRSEPPSSVGQARIYFQPNDSTDNYRSRKNYRSYFDIGSLSVIFNRYSGRYDVKTNVTIADNLRYILRPVTIGLVENYALCLRLLTVYTHSHARTHSPTLSYKFYWFCTYVNISLSTIVSPVVSFNRRNARFFLLIFFFSFSPKKHLENNTFLSL